MDHDAIRDVDDLEDRLSTPTEGVLETMARLEGDLIVLGVAGKMGPTLARMARRASDAVGGRRRVIGVARFTDAASEERLRSHGVETIRCDLLDEDGLARLPDAPNVVYMAGRKFGTTGQEAATWAHERLPARPGLPEVSREPDRRLLDRQRLRARPRRRRRLARVRRAGPPSASTR